MLTLWAAAPRRGVAGGRCLTTSLRVHASQPTPPDPERTREMEGTRVTLALIGVSLPSSGSGGGWPVTAVVQLAVVVGLNSLTGKRRVLTDGLVLYDAASAHWYARSCQVNDHVKESYLIDRFSDFSSGYVRRTE